MYIYNLIELPFAQFSSLDLNKCFSASSQKYAKIAAIALAIISISIAGYFIVKFCTSRKSLDPLQPITSLRKKSINSLEVLQDKVTIDTEKAKEVEESGSAKKDEKDKNIVNKTVDDKNPEKMPKVEPKGEPKIESKVEPKVDHLLKLTSGKKPVNPLQAHSSTRKSVPPLKTHPSLRKPVNLLQPITSLRKKSIDVLEVLQDKVTIDTKKAKEVDESGIAKKDEKDKNIVNKTVDDKNPEKMPKVEPKGEPEIESKVEPKVEQKVEPKIEPKTESKVDHLLKHISGEKSVNPLQAHALPRKPVDPLQLHPSAKKSDDPLQAYTSELAGHINEIKSSLPRDGKTTAKLSNLAFFLIHSNYKKNIESYCNVANKPEYKVTLYQSLTDAYKTLCELFKNEQFPIEKKMEVLERLEAGKNQCVPSHAGLLHDICNSVDEPVDMTKMLPWLIGSYKTEILKAVVTEVHSTNRIIKKHGKELGLPLCVIKAAQADLHTEKSYNLFDNYLKNYRSLCTPQSCIDFLENYINSDLPGRSAYRAHILSCLTEKVPDEQVDGIETQTLIITKHKAALKKEKKREKERHHVKFADIQSPESIAEWKKILQKIKLKKDPFIDAGLYANYHYRLNPEDSEDNKLTTEAIKLFADDSLQSLLINRA